MTQLGYPDGEGGARAWAKTLDLGPASGLVFFGRPRGDSLPRAWVEVKLIDTIAQQEVVPAAIYSLQWDVTARRKRDAWQTVAALELAIKLLRTGSPFGEEAAVLGTEITLGPLWRPDDDAGLARYVLGTLIELRPVAAVTA